MKNSSSTEEEKIERVLDRLDGKKSCRRCGEPLYLTLYSEGMCVRCLADELATLKFYNFYEK